MRKIPAYKVPREAIRDSDIPHTSLESRPYPMLWQCAHFRGLPSQPAAHSFWATTIEGIIKMLMDFSANEKPLLNR